MTDDLLALILTLEVATTSTILLLLVGIPLAWALAKYKFPGKFLLNAVIALPLVLPPTVLGFYFLVFFSQNSFFGQTLQAMGFGSFVFSFQGLVLGSCIYSLPFVVQPIQEVFKKISQEHLDIAATLGFSKWQSFKEIVIPMSKSGIIMATTLGFAHTVGEFGVVLMIGGNIPGKTQVLSVALFNHVEALEYTQAHFIAGSLVLFSLLILSLVYKFNHKHQVSC